MIYKNTKTKTQQPQNNSKDKTVVIQITFIGQATGIGWINHNDILYNGVLNLKRIKKNICIF